MTNRNTGDLRSALQRADVPDYASLPAGIVGGPTLLEAPGQMIPVQRMPIPKVEIKTEVATFIDRVFVGRTGSDGTILSLSKENLVEHLTGLFHSLEQRSAEMGDRFSSPAKQRRPAPEADAHSG